MKLPAGHVPGVGLVQATAYGGLGEKLLKQYGWKEGEGLGLQGKGIKSALKVLKKDDTVGVGGRQVIRQQATSDWWQQSFDSALQNLKEGVSEEASSESETEESEVAVRKVNRDGTLASGTVEELQLEKLLAKDPWGRFGGRNGKLDRIRQQEAAMMAIIEAKSASNLEVVPLQTRPSKRQKLDGSTASKHGALTMESREADEPAMADEGNPILPNKAIPAMAQPGNKSKAELPEAGRGKRAKHGLPNKATQFRRAESELDGTAISEVSAPSQKDWWGASQFVARGCLGGLNDQEASRARQSFTEDTQAELYMTAQATKTAGKQGLGIGKGKSLGHEWKGTKTIIEDCSPQPRAESHSVDGKPEEEPIGDLQIGNEAVAKSESKSLRKLSRQILEKEAGKQLKLSKLAKKLAKQLPSLGCKVHIQSLLVQKVATCSRFAVEDKTIRLLG